MRCSTPRPITAGLGDLGLEAFEVSSRARNREEYLRRPDLGRALDEASEHLLTSRGFGPCRLAIVVGDGLSPSAVNAHAIRAGTEPDSAAGRRRIEIGYCVVATGARVALGDEIGAILGARMIVMLIGERPGLSAPDSLGAYLTFAPKAGLTDAERNCVSKFMPPGSATRKPQRGSRGWSARVLARRITGVALKDDSGVPREITGIALKDEICGPHRRAAIGAGARLRSAGETCYTYWRQIYCMFSRASADQTWPVQASFAPGNLSYTK